MPNKTKEVQIAETIERMSPPKFESDVMLKSVKGKLYLEEYITVKNVIGNPKRRTNAQKGIGSIGIKGFKIRGSYN